MAKIELKNIFKAYDEKVVLNNINITINEGDLTVLLGSSGSGKTTILHGISGLINFDKGNVFINNKIIDNVSIEKRNAVLVDQNLLLFPHMTVASNIAFGLRMRKVKKTIINKKTKELIALVDMVGHEKKYPNELSGGQKQRVAIARALAIEPNVLLLDEPFSKLDITLRKNMQLFVRELQKKLNMTTILVTHDKQEALSMADQVAMLIDGEIKQYAPPNIIYEKPISKEVSDFFGKRNYICGKIEKGNFITKLGTFKTSVQDYKCVTFMFRPEEIQLGEKQGNSIIGTIISKIYFGDNVTYTIKTSNQEIYFSTYTQKDIPINNEVYVNLEFNKGVYFREEELC